MYATSSTNIHFTINLYATAMTILLSAIAEDDPPVRSLIAQLTIYSPPSADRRVQSRYEYSNPHRPGASLQSIPNPPTLAPNPDRLVQLALYLRPIPPTSPPVDPLSTSCSPGDPHCWGLHIPYPLHYQGPATAPNSPSTPPPSSYSRAPPT